MLNLQEFTTEAVLRKDAVAARLGKRKNRLNEALSESSKAEDGKEEDLDGQPGADRQSRANGGQIRPDLGGAEEDELVSDEEEDPGTAKADESAFEFKLVGVVCHMGSADAGHYLSYINTERDRENSDTLAEKSKEDWLATEKQKWLEFNDSAVQSFNFSQLETTCFGGQQNQNAYMLIYEKRLKHPMKVVIPKEVVQALACDGTAMTSAATHLFEVFPRLRSQIEQGAVPVHFDADKDEHFAMVDFDAARKFVPNKIYQMVHRDNLKFLSEKQVFSAAFYKCSLELLQICVMPGPDGGDIANDPAKFELVFKVLDRIVFDLLVNSAANSTLKGMTDLVIVMLSKSDQAVEYLVRQRVFAPKESLGKDEKNFFETLATHQDKEVRDMAAATLCFALIRLLHIGGEANMQLVEDAVTQVLDLMPNECQKHWMRLDTYLTFIYDLARSHVQLLHMLVRHKVVTRLMDLMSKYNPNSLVYVQANPPLESLVLTVSFIARSIPCLIDPNDLPSEEELDRQTAILILMAERGESKYYKPLHQSFSLEKLSDEESVLVLPEDCLKSLFMHVKSFKLFYANASKHGFESLEYAKFVAHVCFKNEEFSRKMAKHILKGTNKSTADEIGPYLQLMKHYLTIDDDLFNLRLEWIFGIADLVVKSASY